MKITSHQARQVRFTPRGSGYDQAEVDDFCLRVANVLTSYEDLVHQLESVDALRRQAEADAATVTQSAHQEALAIKLQAAGEVKKLEAKVRMLEDRLAAEPATTVHESPPRGGGDDDAARVAAASAEAARILAAATAEGDALVAAARRRAAAVGDSMAEETQLVKKRLARLRTAVGDIESRFRGLVGSTLEELALLGDLVALETSPLIDAVQLTSDTSVEEPAVPALADHAALAVGTVQDDMRQDDMLEDDVPEEASALGFYEKRLSGLRSRLREHGA